jgi:hypothetical protein
VQGQADLLEVVGALHPPHRLARRLDGGEQQGDQHGDDRDDDEQFDQGEAALRSLTHGKLLAVACIRVCGKNDGVING